MKNFSKTPFTVFVFIAAGSFFSASQLSAKVSGTCATCHTMHNSQNATPMARSGDGTGWTGDDGTLTGVESDEPQANLLVSDCVGCHSSTNDNTIVVIGSNRIPIVFNTNEYPQKQLAGGNFYQVAQGSSYDGYGHNVYGISNADLQLTAAPGNTRCSGGGPSGSCHQSLANPPATSMFGRSGCQGCHFHVNHHEDNVNYRFLNSHEAERGEFGANQAFVEGVEHESWEHPDSASASDHNFYKGINKAKYDNNNESGYLLKHTHSISSYCAGCHHDFHSAGGTGTASPWLRHPTDIALPMEGEYLAYNPTTDYSLEAPVAWENPAAPVREEAIVMCLSCHRVHGSEYPDILRWNYDEMIAGGDEENTSGCFVCHTTKD